MPNTKLFAYTFGQRLGAKPLGFNCKSEHKMIRQIRSEYGLFLKKTKITFIRLGRSNMITKHRSVGPLFLVHHVNLPVPTRNLSRVLSLNRKYNWHFHKFNIAIAAVGIIREPTVTSSCRYN